MYEILAATVGAAAAVIVWFLSARHLAKQERDAKRRELRLQFLIDAYRKIERSSNRDYSHDSQYARDYEAAIADIHLFGSKEQIALAQSVVDDFASNGFSSCDSLLESLRSSLRQELGLEHVSGRRVYARIVPKRPA